MPLLADRTRKARRSSVLACGCYVQTGHLIARVKGRWVCVECLFAARESGTSPSGELATR